MNGWTEQELIYEAAFQYEWGYSGELEKAARECIARIKAAAWDEGQADERDYISAFDNWREHITDHIPEPPTNPYRDNK